MAEPLQRVSEATRRVLSVFLENPEEEIYGREIVRKSKSHSGTVYPILDRLEKYGWVRASWETSQAAEISRPLRRYYRLTKGGYRLASRVLKDKEAKSVIPSQEFINTHYRGSELIRIKSREEHTVFEDGFTNNVGKFDIEVDPETPGVFQFPFFIQTNLDAENPISIEAVLINGVDNTCNIELFAERIIIDLIEEHKTFQNLISIPTDVVGKNRHLALEVATVVKGDKLRLLQAFIPYQTDYLKMSAESRMSRTAENLDAPFEGELGSQVSSRIGIDGPVDLKESKTVSRDVRYKNNIVVWEPKKVKLGYNYDLELSNLGSQAVA